ncbi:MAG: MGMT family protein [Actinomycetes bacterium]
MVSRGRDPQLPSVFAETVLDLVAGIPTGRAVSYGDVARWLGRGGPRQVGAVMAAFGDGVPWWRVVRADGTAAPAIAVEAGRRWRSEGTPTLSKGRRVDLARARWEGPAEVSGARGTHDL